MKLKKPEIDEIFENDEENTIAEVRVERAILNLNGKGAPGSVGITSDKFKTRKNCCYCYLYPITYLFKDFHENQLALFHLNKR